MTFWKRRNVVPCFITFYRKILLLNVLRNLYLFELAYSSIKDFGRLVTTIFLLMKHLHCRFSTFREKLKKIYWLQVWIYCKMHHRISSFLTLRSPVASLHAWSNASWRILFSENMVTIGIIYATDPLLQNMTRNNCLRWLNSDNFNYKPDHADLRARFFSKLGWQFTVKRS